MKLAALVDRDTATGLRLAGIKKVFVPNEKSVKQLWYEIEESSDIGILFITEKLVEELGGKIKDYRLRNNIPIIVEIPDREGRVEDHEDFISHLIKKAVGVKVEKTKR